MLFLFTDQDYPNSTAKAISELKRMEKLMKEDNLIELICFVEACILLFFGVFSIKQLHIHITSVSLVDYFIFIPAYFLAGWNVICQAIKDLSHGKILTPSCLTSLSSLGAFAIHQLPGAIIITLLYGLWSFKVKSK